MLFVVGKLWTQAIGNSKTKSNSLNQAYNAVFFQGFFINCKLKFIFALNFGVKKNQKKI